MTLIRLLTYNADNARLLMGCLAALSALALAATKAAEIRFFRR